MKAPIVSVTVKASDIMRLVNPLSAAMFDLKLYGMPFWLGHLRHLRREENRRLLAARNPRRRPRRVNGRLLAKGAK